jgi:hypothetical protein
LDDGVDEGLLEVEQWNADDADCLRFKIDKINNVRDSSFRFASFGMTGTVALEELRRAKPAATPPHSAKNLVIPNKVRNLSE